MCCAPSPIGPLPVREGNIGTQVKNLRYIAYGTILVAGSLQGLWPLSLTAATRNAVSPRSGRMKIAHRFIGGIRRGSEEESVKRTAER